MSALFKARSSSLESDDSQNAAILPQAAPSTPDAGGLASTPASPADDVPENQPHVWAQHVAEDDETQGDDNGDYEQKFTWHPFGGDLKVPANSLLGEQLPGVNSQQASPSSNQFPQSKANPKTWSLEDLITQQSYSPIVSRSAFHCI